MALDPLTAGLDLARSVIDKIWPDKSDQEKQELAGAITIISGQMAVNQVEAGSDSMFVAGWRPWIGWVCGLALFMQYIARPVIQWAAIVVNHPLPELPGIDDNLWELMLGMLGLGGLRSFDKAKRLLKK